MTLFCQNRISLIRLPCKDILLRCKNTDIDYDSKIVKNTIEGKPV